MADATITQADIDNLAQKLDQQLGGLSDKEKAILHGVFALAGSAVERARAGGKSKGDPTLSISGAVAPLSSGFKEAFKPGASAQFQTAGKGGQDPDHLITWTRGSVAVGV